MAKKAAKAAPKPAKAAKKKETAEPSVKAKAKPKEAAKLEAAPAMDPDITQKIEVEVPTKPVKVKAEKVKKISAKARAELAETAESNRKWHELKEKHAAEKAVSYTMTGVFTSQTPIQHKIFGWGFIINSENDRLEVLFETGTKQLISNYKR